MSGTPQKAERTPTICTKKRSYRSSQVITSSEWIPSGRVCSTSRPRERKGHTRQKKKGNVEHDPISLNAAASTARVYQTMQASLLSRKFPTSGAIRTPHHLIRSYLNKAFFLSRFFSSIFFFFLSSFTPLLTPYILEILYKFLSCRARSVHKVAAVTLAKSDRYYSHTTEAIFARSSSIPIRFLPQPASPSKQKKESPSRGKSATTRIFRNQRPISFTSYLYHLEP